MTTNYEKHGAATVQTIKSTTPCT